MAIALEKVSFHSNPKIRGRSPAFTALCSGPGWVASAVAGLWGLVSLVLPTPSFKSLQVNHLNGILFSLSDAADYYIQEDLIQCS